MPALLTLVSNNIKVGLVFNGNHFIYFKNINKKDYTLLLLDFF